MRTSILIATAMLAATGCTPGQLAYDHTADFGVDSRGVEYTDDQSAQVGMNSVTCAVNPNTAMIEEDVDVVDDDDEIADAFNGEALVVDGAGVTFYNPSTWSWNDDLGHDIEAPSLQAAGYAAAGTVIVSNLEGCDISFHGDTVQSVGLDASCNGASLASSGHVDSVAVVTDGLAFLVSPAGDITDLGAATHAAMQADGTLYLATDRELQAFAADGSSLWTAPLDGEVVDMDAIGAHAAVMLAHANGEGELRTFDALGLESSSLRTPSPAEAISASESGRELAMVLPSRIHFFEVNGLN